MNLSNTLASLAIIVPCYNEQEVFPVTRKFLSQLLERLVFEKKIHASSYVLFVDDGSQDGTWEKIQNASKQNKYMRGIKLSHNRGHQIALLAGLSYSDTEVTISIDADLQDDLQAIEKMLDLYYLGNDIVYGVRNSRKTDSFFKRTTALAFYKLMGVFGVEQVYNHADYRLMSRRALNALLQYQEENLYLRGLVPLIGFKTAKVYYDRARRVAGDSKYSLKKMVYFATEGITSLSVIPLRFITFLGFFVFLLSIIGAIYIVIQKLSGETIQGWASTIIAVACIGGLQMLALGIIGEYIGKIFNEVKKRPKYFIEEIALFSDCQKDEN